MDRANASLAADIAAERFCILAAAVGEARWAGDAASLPSLAAEYGAADPGTAARAVEAGKAHSEARISLLERALAEQDDPKTWYRLGRAKREAKDLTGAAGRRVAAGDVIY